MPRAQRICCEVTCGKVATNGRRCATCASDYEKNVRGSATARGYGPAHDAVARALKSAFGAAYRRGEAPRCWRCGERMHPRQSLDADHSQVKAAEGGVADCLTHAACNRGKRLPTAPPGSVDHGSQVEAPPPSGGR